MGEKKQCGFCNKFEEDRNGIGLCKKAKPYKIRVVSDICDYEKQTAEIMLKKQEKKNEYDK